MKEKKYTVKFTSKFKKDFKLAIKQNKNKDELFKVIDILADGNPLPDRYRDHSLNGNYIGYRECHIEPDWLLIYKYFNDTLILSLSRLGSHSDLFK